MAVLDKKEQKIQVVLGRLPKKYTHEEFVEMFIKLYSKDWGKIKAAYVKQNQDKEPGTVVNMPKPELYLKQILSLYLDKSTEKTVETPIKPADIAPGKVKDAKPSTPSKTKPAAANKTKATSKAKPDENEAKVVKSTKAKPKVSASKATDVEAIKKAKK